MARPKGSRNFSGIEKRLLDDAKGKSGVVLAATLEEALSGNVQAQKLILDKVLPNLKPEARRITFKLNESGTLSQQASDILTACSNGVVPYEVASSLITSLGGIMKIKESEEFEARLAELEKRAADGN